MYWLSAFAVVWGAFAAYLAIKRPGLGVLAGAAGVFMALWGSWDALILLNETNDTYYRFYVNAAPGAIILNGVVIVVGLFVMMLSWVTLRRRARTELPGF